METFFAIIYYMQYYLLFCYKNNSFLKIYFHRFVWKYSIIHKYLTQFNLELSFKLNQYEYNYFSMRYY